MEYPKMIQERYTSDHKCAQILCSGCQSRVMEIGLIGLNIQYVMWRGNQNHYTYSSVKLIIMKRHGVKVLILMCCLALK